MTDNPRDPNIILIVLDTLRADHLSTYGYHRQTTPNIDRFAKNSSLYKNAITQSPWTLPSHLSIFTGLYPSEHGVVHEKTAERENMTYLTEYLNNAGYRTAIFTNNPWISPEFGFDRGTENLEPTYKDHRRSRSKLGKLSRQFQKSFGLTDSGANLSLKKFNSWLDTQQTNNQPFFAFFNFMETHQVYSPPLQTRGQFGGMRSYYDVLWNHRLYHSRGKIITGKKQIDQEEQQRLKNLYDEELLYLDSKIDDLLTTLRQKSLLEDSLVVITSDHGEHFGETRLDEGGQLVEHAFSIHDNLIHVPLIVQFPDRNGSQTIERPVELIDLYPTILKVLNHESSDVNQNLSGTELNTLNNNSFKSAYVEYETSPSQISHLQEHVSDFDFSRLEMKLEAVRTESAKLVMRTKDQETSERFYDLSSNQQETKNLLEKKDTAQIQNYEKLKNELRSIKDNLTKAEKIYKTEEFEEEMKDRLSDLGYL